MGCLLELKYAINAGRLKMDENTRLEDVLDEFTKRPVYEWEYIPIDGLCRIYYRLEPEVMGFVFYVLESIGCYEHNGKTDDWSPRYSLVEILWHGNALYDGIRHLYQGDELTGNYGYLYYPDIPRIIKIFTQLHELQKRYCREWMEIK